MPPPVVRVFPVFGMVGVLLGQRYALFFGQLHVYEVKYRNTTQLANADALSRLLKKGEEFEVDEGCTTVHEAYGRFRSVNENN